MSLKINIVANLVGQVWRSVMALAFVPVYLSVLGAEGYGLIGVHALLLVSLTVFDAGLRPMLVREMARFTGSAHDATSIRRLLRSIEWIVGIIAVLVASSVWLLSSVAASHWLNAKELDFNTVSGAIAIMGAVVGLQLVESTYGSALLGVQRQVLVNGLLLVFSTLRSAGSALVLLFVSPTVEAYFWWNLAVSIVSALSHAIAVYRVLPATNEPIGFAIAPLKPVYRFAGGTLAISLITLALGQGDKVLVSAMMTLEDFSHYSLAAVAAGMISVAAAPFGLAFAPRLTQLHAQRDDRALSVKIHEFTQLLAAIVASMACMLAFFGHELLVLWTRNAALASEVYPIVAILAAGAACNVLMAVPYLRQLALGKTAPTIAIGAVSLALVVPVWLLVIPQWGLAGAALGSVGLNVIQLAVAAPISFRGWPASDLARWYVNDIAFVAAAAAFVPALAWMIVKTDPAGAPLLTLGVLTAIGCTSLLCASIAARDVRAHALMLFASLRRKTTNPP